MSTEKKPAGKKISEGADSKGAESKAADPKGAESKAADAKGAETKGTPEDIKAKFREALEKKSQHKHPHESAGDGDSKAHGEHAKAGHDKTFRRKSG